MIGGNSGINKRIDVMETEVYSPDFDQWTMVAQLSMGQSEAGACLVNDRIFIVGGYCWSARRCIKVIQVRFSRKVYDTKVEIIRSFPWNFTIIQSKFE